jgi:tetratricopeptide (TPR) repeat protein
MTLLYHTDAYDKHLCLKLSAGMILAMVFAMRHVLLVFLTYFPGMAGTADVSFVKGFLSPYLVFSDVTAVLLLVAWRFRQPEAGKSWRVIWRHGRFMLTATLFVQLILLADTRWGRQIIQAPQSDESTLVIGYALVQLYVIAYVLLSNRLKAVFLNFPVPGAVVEPARPMPCVGHAEKSAASASGDAEASNPFEGLTEPVAALVTERLKAAIRLIRPDQPEEAERLAKVLAQGSQESAAVWHDLGMLAVQRDKLQEAAILVSRATKADAGNGLFFRNLCEINRRIGQLDAALQAGHKAVSLMPNDADAYFNLALVFAQANRPKAAIGSYETAVRLRPGHAQAWNNLGLLYRQMKRPEEAKRAFEAALIAIPGMPEAKRNLEAIV